MATDDLTCDFCGTALGNAGAKTQHENACDQNPANQGGQQDQQLDRREVREARPVSQEQGAGGAGQAIGELLFAITSDEASPQTKGKAAAQGLGLAGQVIQSYQDLRFRNEQRKEETAKAVELEPAVDYPACGECDYQFGSDDVGAGEGQVRCPECGALWNIRVEEQPA